jgi:hypothetical protein
VLELGFSLVLLLQYSRPDKARFGTVIDYGLGCILAAGIFILPIFIIAFYLKNIDKLDDEEFQEKFGSVYEGLVTGKKSAIAYSVFFIIRRAAFAAASLFLYDKVLLQLPAMTFLTIMGVAYLTTFSPFEDKLCENLDILNEVCTVLLIDICYLFTDVWPNPTGQYKVGYAFIIIMAGCIFTHLFFLMKSVLNDLKLRVKRWIYRRQKIREVGSSNKLIAEEINEVAADTLTKNEPA